MTPASPFYFVERFFEGVGTFFTFGNSAKAERYLTLAEERLAEANVLAGDGDERAQHHVTLKFFKIYSHVFPLKHKMRFREHT